MNALDALTKIRVMLGIDTQEVSVELAEATLVDGSVVKVEGEFEVGKQLLLVTEEGEVPAPEGVHQTTDNKLITVDADGVITEITEVVEETENSEFSAQVVKLFEAMNARLNAIEARFADLNSDFHQFRDEPAAPRIKNNLTETIKSDSSLKEDRYQQLLQMRGKK